VGRTNALGERNDDALVQELLDGTEYVVDTVSAGGRHRAVAFWRYHRPGPTGDCPFYDAIELLRPARGRQEALLAAAALGLLEGIVETDRLNLINARAIAEARGVELSVAESAQLGPSTIEVSLRGGIQELAVAGVAPSGATPRLTRIGGFHVDVNPRQTLIVLTNYDVPGVIGRVGTLLGDAGVNIAEYHQARLAQGGEALAVISVDDGADAALRQHLLELPDVRSATVVTFRGE
jgi:D-3-phosphoglycerate dehydrogenase